MRLSKFIQAVSFGTLVALIYIHMQMQIFCLAYQGQGLEDDIQRISEFNAATAYQILELKSVNHLGHSLLAQGDPMRFRDRHNMIQLVDASPVTLPEDRIAAARDHKGHSLFSFLTVKAEARTSPAGERNLFGILGKEKSRR